jgi:hypothetical protein
MNPTITQSARESASDRTVMTNNSGSHSGPSTAAAN